jgi:hypothetical protein
MFVPVHEGVRELGEKCGMWLQAVHKIRTLYARMHKHKQAHTHTQSPAGVHNISITISNKLHVPPVLKLCQLV